MLQQILSPDLNNELPKKAGLSGAYLKDNRAESVAQRKQTGGLANKGTDNPPIQRKANNTGLPDQLKSGVENLSGLSMDDVKVHYNSNKPAQLQALAYAQGPDIHLASGQEKHLPHEAWHVVQQKQGRVKPTVQMKGNTAINNDEGLENEADVMGAKATEHGGKAAQLKSTMVVSGKVAQRMLTVGAVDYTAAYTANVGNIDAQTDALMGLLDTAVNGTDIQADFATNRAAIRSQLKKWIMDDAGNVAGSHPVFGRKRQYRIYDTRINLARGLLGWVRAKPGRKQEKAFADNVYSNVSIAANIDTLLGKVLNKINNLVADGLVNAPRLAKIKQELSTDVPAPPKAAATHLGHYQHALDHHATLSARIRTNIGKNQLEVVSNPLLFKLRDKVVVLHDLMEYFGTRPNWVADNHGAGLMADPAADKQRSTTTIDGMGVRTAYTNDRGKMDGNIFAGRRSHATRNETEAGTQLARQHNVPIWAGQSFTAMRMLNLADWVGGSTAEKTALAWAIFAFWRKDYDHTSEYAYHTLHEVMDIASNFGVQYNMLNRGAGLTENRLSTAATGQTVTQEADKLKAYVDQFRNYYNRRYKQYLDNKRWLLGGIYAPFDDLQERMNTTNQNAVRADVATFNTHITQAKAGVNAQANLDSAAVLARDIKSGILQLNQLLTDKGVPA
jgi:hypothetical protein